VAYAIVVVDELPEPLVPLVDPVLVPVPVVVPLLPVPVAVPVDDVPVPPVVPPLEVSPGLLAPLPPPEPDDDAAEPPEPELPPPPHDTNSATIKAVASHVHTRDPALGSAGPVSCLRIIASFFSHRAGRAPRRVAE
jgi:hypothetical protein